LQSALDLAARGFAVFPLRPNSKLPLLRGWPELATTDTSQIQKWWMKHPDANIGIATGEKSGILVIDVDGEPGRASLAILESKHGALPPTRTVKSIRPDRGEHRYFKFPAGIRIKNSASKVGAGIDVKSSGGQTVGPGSVKDGKTYQWGDGGVDVPIAELPAAWITLLSEPASRPKPPPASEIKLNVPEAERIALCRNHIATLPPSVEGQVGSNPFFKAACDCVRFGLSDESAFCVLGEYNLRAEPPWSAEEIAHKLTDARREAGDEFGVMLEVAIQPKEIILGTDEFRVADETEVALSADEDLYHRGGAIVHVIRDEVNDGISRPVDAPTIAVASSAFIREEATKFARFLKIVRKDGEQLVVAAHPPAWLPAALASRGRWPKLRRLTAISDSPVLRSDGSIHQKPGYDPTSEVLFCPSIPFPEMPRDITIDEARAAQSRLMGEVFGDFRFEAPEHRAATLAALLTPLARHAFSGPAPLFLIDSNIRGAGKGLLAQCIAEIDLGREMAVCGYSNDSAEFAKRITSMALAGDSMVLLDNIEGNLGNDALDRALTGTRWRDRILGLNQMTDSPLLMVWYGSGNNVMVAADTARRIIHIRLDVLEEKPEERVDFKHPDLLGWVRQNRPQLLVDALTVLAGYIRAGRPDQKLTPFGSFEGWSGLVRSAVVWAGLPDPNATRARLAEMADTSADILGQLIEALLEYDRARRGFTVAEVLRQLYSYQCAMENPGAAAMRVAFEALAGSPPGKVPTPRQVGNGLRRYRRRVSRGHYLDIDRKSMNGVVWRLNESK
jgi:hypothetical protein